MSKKNPNGKVVLYTELGAKVVDAAVSNVVRAFGGPFEDAVKYIPSTLAVPKDLRYIVVAVVKTVPNEFPLQPMPHIIDEALKYSQTKFFRLIIDLMKIAQFNPFEGGYAFGTDRFHRIKNVHEPLDFDIDFSVSVPEIDAQLYRKYGFSKPMIAFVEGRYSYDGTGLEPR